MSKKRNIIIVALLSLFFSVIFKKALHDHEHANHAHNEKTVPVLIDTVFVNNYVKMLDVYFVGK